MSTEQTERLSALVGNHVWTKLQSYDKHAWSTPITWRQPIHTVYVPADKVTATLPAEWAAIGLSGLDRPLAEIALALGIPDSVAKEVAARTELKLQKEPIEDLRIDFEDGFTQLGIIGESARQAHEDQCAEAAVSSLTAFFDKKVNCAPSFAGVRIKSLSKQTRDRGLRTLVLILSGLNESGVLSRITPRQLRITLPKVRHHSEVSAFADVLDILSEELSLPFVPHFEVQVETPEAIISSNGSLEAAKLVDSARGLCLAFHYGTYDYSASLGIDAPEQSLRHPVACFAKDTLQVVASSYGVEVSDGSTNLIAAGAGDDLIKGLRNHFELVLYHLRRGIRQGWDLAPIQLVTRQLATIYYFRQNYEDAAVRLHSYLANNESAWMDEPATAKAMAGFLQRAIDCQAIDPQALIPFELGDEELLHNLALTGRPTKEAHD